MSLFESLFEVLSAIWLYRDNDDQLRELIWKSKNLSASTKTTQFFL